MHTLIQVEIIQKLSEYRGILSVEQISLNPFGLFANNAAWPNQHEPKPVKAMQGVGFNNFKCTHEK